VGRQRNWGCEPTLDQITSAIINSVVEVQPGRAPGYSRLLNFNSVHLRAGILRVVNRFVQPPAASSAPSAPPA
jgi:hypothetical protein